MTAAAIAPATPTGRGPVTAFRSRLLRAWRAGEREDVIRELSVHADTAEWRLTLVAARFARDVALDPAARPQPVSARERGIVLNALFDFGTLATARAYIAATERGAAGGAAAELETLVRWAPPTPPAQDEGEFADDPAADVQVVTRAGAQTALLVFAGGAQRFNGPLGLVHQWFRLLDAHIVYLRDRDGMFFAGGIRSLGEDVTETIAALRGIAGGLGAERVACAGSSSGSFGAMRYGLALGAGGVLCLAGPSRIDDSAPRVMERQRRRRPDSVPMGAEEFDCAAFYAAAARRPQVRIVFGAENEHDRTEASHMAHLAGVELDPLADVEEHGVLARIVPDGGFEARLRWLMGAEALSDPRA